MAENKNAKETTLEKEVKVMPSSSEIVKKGRYRVFNGTDYELIHLETTSDQVIESESKKFVSQTEKNTWNSKADSNHNHDAVYAKKEVTYTKTEVDEKLDAKANATHGHSATDIGTDSSHRFVTDAEKTRWNNTYTKGEVDGFVSTINDAIAEKDQANTAEHAQIKKDFAAADKIISDKVTTVESNLNQAVEDLTNLINNGGTANTELAGRVDKLEKTEIPGIKNSISALDGRLTPKVTALEEGKADKTAVTEEINAAKTDLTGKINVKADKKYVDDNLDLKADKETTYTKEEVNAELSTKVSTETMTSELAKKVDKSTYSTEMAKKADKSEMDTALEAKADKTFVTGQLDLKADKTHTHVASQITGLGTVASKNVGVSAGQIPILDDNGKLAESILPSIAVNEVFVAENVTEAMKLKMEVGDILILNDLTSLKTVSEEYAAHAASGKLTFLCVKSDAIEFDDKFKPLQSSGDSITKAEVDAALLKKVDKTTYESEKSAMNEKIDSKANTADVFNKTETTNLLNNKVDKVNGKQLSTNDFTNALKDKLEGIENGANNYTHPTGDGNLHVPATGTTNNRKVLMAGPTAGSMTWTQLTSDNISTNDNKKFVSKEQTDKWDAKADANHVHEQYRLISDSLSTSQTRTEINKLKTIISESAPAPGTQIAGAVWIEEIV